VAQLPAVTKIKTPFILALPVVVYGKQPMAVLTGKIFLINNLAVQ